MFVRMGKVAVVVAGVMILSAGVAEANTAHDGWQNNLNAWYPQNWGYNQSGYGYNYGNNWNTPPAPKCTITLSASSGVYSSAHHSQDWNRNNPNAAFLVWSSTNAHTAEITSIGNVSPSGMQVVYPTTGQVYTMTARGPGGVITCQVNYYHSTSGAYPTSYPYTYPYQYQQSDYSNTYPYSYQYLQPNYQNYQIGQIIPTTVLPAQVSLKQIPYTGVGLGAFGDATAWLSIILMALLGAGLIAHKKREDLVSWLS